MRKLGLLYLLATGLVTGPLIQTANAGVIGTQAAIDLESRAERLDEINAMLARGDVQDALVELGVDPDDAAERVAMMTDAELELLEAQLDELPAGGVSALGVVGIVAIVLIVLELLDVTDLFTAF
jgi:hypothetical protein